ncbi:MAG TPA: hypothetical protein ENG78_04385 [Acidiferrobacteraceae bacterium]|nr:hypothetical protein [Acidiferrobacteraceae bacterium]HEX20042.1 hypothetical protein [Acidiferrobacteraceae bacterium]
MNNELSQPEQKGVTWFTLFTTTGTLVCCALPIILVTLGLGATVAAITSYFPFLITLSQHKAWVFAFSGTMLVLSGWLIYRPDRACPIDAELGVLCNKAHVWNRRLYWTSMVIWGIGFFAAYLALPIRIWLDA